MRPLLPVEFKAYLSNKFPPLIIFVWSVAFKWWVPGNHNKKHHPQGEDIAFGEIVDGSVVNFRCCESSTTSNRFLWLAKIDSACKSEITELHTILI